MKRCVFAAILAAVLLLTLGAQGALADLKCLACGGSGKVQCSNCNGNGKVVRYGGVVSGCGYCGGKGKVKCTACGGDGKIGSSDPGTSGDGSGEHKADLSRTSLTLIAGRSETLKVNWASGKVKWSSSNKSVATVSSKGKVKAKKAGKCTITAKTGKQTLKCKVTVKKRVYAKSLALNATSATLLPDGTLDLSYTVSPDPEKITESWSVSWSSSDSNVVTVNSDGHVCARGTGEATVTAKLKIKKGKTKKFKCAVAVENGLDRFARWFGKNCAQADGRQVCYTSDTDQIIRDPSDGSWTFYRYEKTYNGYDETAIRFNSDFTGEANIRFYWYRSGAYTGVSEVECTAVQSTGSLSRDTVYSWSFTKGSQRDHSVADANVKSLLSSMNVLLRDQAGLDAGVGWRDLGLKAY